MGWGDEIMVTAQARKLQERDRRQVVVVDYWGRPRWHPIWANNPRIARPPAHSTRPLQVLRNYPGNRPYLDYAKFNNRDRNSPFVYTDWRVEPGEIYLTESERDRNFPGSVIIEPTIKPGAASPNKDWGWSRWQALAYELRDLPLLQIGPMPGTRILDGVDYVPTNDVRAAAGMLASAALYVGPEGGLHHAAAALGVRAVVIFGGFISPATTGYDLHTNVFTGGRACGMRVPCRHCEEAMAAIHPWQIAELARARFLEAQNEGGKNGLRISAAG